MKKIFEHHSIIFENQKKEFCEKHPDFNINPEMHFNMCMALHNICKEILEIKNKLNKDE